MGSGCEPAWWVGGTGKLGDGQEPAARRGWVRGRAGARSHWAFIGHLRALVFIL